MGCSSDQVSLTTAISGSYPPNNPFSLGELGLNQDFLDNYFIGSRFADRLTTGTTVAGLPEFISTIIVWC